MEYLKETIRLIEIKVIHIYVLFRTTYNHFGDSVQYIIHLLDRLVKRIPLYFAPTISHVLTSVC